MMIFLAVIIQVVFYAVLAMLIESSLGFTHIHAQWRLRLAFLLSSALTLVVPWYRSFFAIHPVWMILTGVIGAFLGSLVATGRKTPLWENNSPPPDETWQNVLQIHQDKIGKGNPTALSKRLFDLGLACFILLVLSPVYILIVFLIWFEDPGAILFVKNSVGKGGITFHQFKLRTMVQGAEEATGPILASIRDTRILKIGRWLRKSHLDELPQLVNILKGEMSFVGPRPQRTVLVSNYLQEIPGYVERHRVLPGIAGLAQVAGSYYLTPRQKLRFDQLYVANMSLIFDLRLLFSACIIAFWYRWQNDWDGRLPRWMLH